MRCNIAAGRLQFSVEVICLQGIIEEFNLGISSHVSITNFAAGGFGGAVSPCCKLLPSPPILLYITSRFGYIKHLFCWQLISVLNFKLGLQTSYPLARMFIFRTLATAFPTSYHMKTVLVELENSAMMHAHSSSFPVLLS